MNIFKTQTVTITTMTITPDDARLILSQGAPNRPLNEGLVARYACDMADGLWQQTGEPIKFDHEGNLIDGQHRLNALVKSGVTIEFVVVTGLSFATQDTMDSGRKRSLGDQLAMRGYKNTNQLAAAIVMLMAWERSGKPERRAFKTTNSQALRWFENNPGVESSMNAVEAARRSVRYPGSLATAIHYRMSLISPANADFFWKVLADGRSVSGTSTILTLRDRMIKAAVSKEGSAQSMAVVYRAALTIRAWNAWIEGRDLSKLAWRPHTGEEFPLFVHPEESI